ncbi:unnamed protein product [Closterium sp. NIES-54]
MKSVKISVELPAGRGRVRGRGRGGGDRGIQGGSSNVNTSVELPAAEWRRERNHFPRNRFPLSQPLPSSSHSPTTTNTTATATTTTTTSPIPRSSQKCSPQTLHHLTQILYISLLATAKPHQSSATINWFELQGCVAAQGSPQEEAQALVGEGGGQTPQEEHVGTVLLLPATAAAAAAAEGAGGAGAGATGACGAGGGGVGGGGIRGSKGESIKRGEEGSGTGANGSVPRGKVQVDVPCTLAYECRDVG